MFPGYMPLHLSLLGGDILVSLCGSYVGSFHLFSIHRSTWQTYKSLTSWVNWRTYYLAAKDIFALFYGWSRAWRKLVSFDIQGMVSLPDTWTCGLIVYLPFLSTSFVFVVIQVIIISFHMLLPWVCHHVLSISHHISLEIILENWN